MGICPRLSSPRGAHCPCPATPGTPQAYPWAEGPLSAQPGAISPCLSDVVGLPGSSSISLNRLLWVARLLNGPWDMHHASLCPASNLLSWTNLGPTLQPGLRPGQVHLLCSWRDLSPAHCVQTLWDCTHCWGHGRLWDYPKSFVSSLTSLRPDRRKPKCYSVVCPPSTTCWVSLCGFMHLQPQLLKLYLCAIMNLSLTRPENLLVRRYLSSSLCSFLCFTSDGHE